MIFRRRRTERRVAAVDDAVEPVVGQVAAELADVVYVIRELPDLAFEYVSPSVEKLTGFTPAEHYANPELSSLIIDPHDRHLVRMVRGRPPGSTTDVTVRWVAKDGRRIWVHHRARTVLRADGSQAIYGAARDVTEEMVAQQQADAATGLLRSTFDAIPDPLLVWHVDRNDPAKTRLLTTNPASTALVGEQSQDIVGKTLTDVFPADIAASVNATFVDALDTGCHRAPHCLMPGSARVWRPTICAAPEDQVVMLLRDVTADVRREEELERSELRFRMLAEHAADVVVELAADNTISWVSPALTPLTGWLPSQVVGHPSIDYVHPEDVELVMHARSTPYNSNTTHSRYRMRCADGSYRWVIGTRRHITDREGNVTDRIINVRDIHDDVLLEQATRREERARRAALHRRLGAFEPELSDMDFDEDLVRTIVRDVLRDGALTPVFQPIVHMRDGSRVGVEALTRFPPGPLGSPAAWFTAAHRVGLGVDLEIQALREALPALSVLGCEEFLSVNLSPALILGGLPQDIMRAVAWERIVLELTEHTPVHDYVEIGGAISPLRSRGARVAVDDTGSGFASLRHILNLSPEIVKLDREMIQGVDEDMRRSSVAEMILRFAQRVGAVVVTEGVETPAERDALLALGADLGQGYLFGRPGPL